MCTCWKPASALNSSIRALTSCRVIFSRSAMLAQIDVIDDSFVRLDDDRGIIAAEIHAKITLRDEHCAATAGVRR